MNLFWSMFTGFAMSLTAIVAAVPTLFLCGFGFIHDGEASMAGAAADLAHLLPYFAASAIVVGPIFASPWFRDRPMNVWFGAFIGAATGLFTAAIAGIIWGAFVQPSPHGPSNAAFGAIFGLLIFSYMLSIPTILIGAV